MWFDKGVQYPECDFHDLQRLAVSRAVEQSSSRAGEYIFVEVGTFLGEGLHCLMDKISASDLKAKIFAVDNFELHFMNRENTEDFDLSIEPVLELPNEKRLVSLGYKGMLVEFFNRLREAGKEKNLTGVLVGKSWDLARTFADKAVYFCFIDAGHSYNAVKLDLEAWYPKMRDDGIFCGHDWYSGPGVRKAVIEFAEKHGLGIQTFQSGWRLVRA